VVLGVPDPPAAPRLRVLSQRHAGGEAVRSRLTRPNRRQVEDGERDAHVTNRSLTILGHDLAPRADAELSKDRLEVISSE
jgi:hypothetical protein